MADAQIAYEIQLALQRYSRDIRQATKDAKSLDAALEAVRKQARQTSAALNKLSGDIDLTVKVDTSQVAGAESDVKALSGMSPNVDVQVDTSQIMGAEIDLRTLDNFSPDVTVDVSVDAAQVQTQLNSITAPDLEVDVTANEEQAQAELDNLTVPDLRVMVDADTTQADTRIGNVARRTPTVTAELEADTSSGEADIKASLDELKGLAKIQVALELLPMAGGLVGGAAGMFQGIANPILEADRAIKQLRATTGEFIPDAEELVDNVFTDGWGESRTEVAETIAAFVRLRGASGDLRAEVGSTFATAQLMGRDFNEVLNASDRIVSSGLVDSIGEANSLLAVGFKQGGDRADDLLDTFVEYSSQFAQMGIDGPAALNLINQSLEAGTFNSDKLGDTFKELNLKITEAVATGEGAAADALKRVGLFDEAEALAAGEITGLQFAKGAQDALKSGEAGEFDLYEIFGTPLEDLGIDIFKNLDFDAAMAAVAPPEDAADYFGSVYNNNLEQTLTETGRLIQENILDHMGGVESILDKVNEKAREFNSLLRGGADIPEALEITLQMPGLADMFHSFESAIGNFILELEVGIANILEGLGNMEAAEQIRGDIKERAAVQLEFDFQTATTEADFTTAIDNAVRRGVESGAASEAANAAIARLLESGNIAAAQALIETIETQPPATITFEAVSAEKGLHNVTLPIDLDPEMTPEQVDAAVQAAIDAFQAQGGDATGYGRNNVTVDMNPQFDVTEAQTQVDEYRTTFTDGLAGLQTFVTDIFNPQQEPLISDLDATNIAAAALSAGDLATAYQAAQDAGWPITEDQLAMIGDAGADFYTLQGKLTEYTLGLQDAKTDGTAALGTLKTAGIDVVIAAQDDMLGGMDAYVLGVQGGLEIAKVSWQDYIDWLASNGLTIDTVVTPPTVPGKSDGLATGGRANPGWTLVGEQGPELAYFGQGADVLNNQTSSALMGLISQLGGGGSTVNNYINVNVLQNNNSQAAGNASAGTLSAQLRGFAR